MQVKQKGFYRKYTKRLMDVILSLCAIFLFAPVMIVVALLVKVKLGKPVIFKQERPGLHERVFTIYKFRTMAGGQEESREPHIYMAKLTRFGKLLRSTSLDELPELFNILKGDMSVVGPRPLLVEYLPLYNDFQKRRHEVRPGLSGLAQVNGRNAISWEQKFKYDVEYINNITFIGDLKIILLTIAKVFSREGINSDAMVTMEAFKGNQEIVPD